jgi:transcriptional regulator
MIYNPRHFRQADPQAVEELMRQHPLATLVTVSSKGICASHIPLLYVASGEGPGVLRGHMAKANPQWSDVIPGMHALAIFHGPEHYITPNWYPSKTEHGRVVPTWNYVVVHAQGPLRAIQDREWLKQNVRELTAVHEAQFPNPWKLEETPDGFIDQMLNAIVGIEVTIEALEGKWKASQNRPEADRASVIAGLQELGTPDANRMAEIVVQANRRE